MFKNEYVIYTEEGYAFPVIAKDSVEAYFKISKNYKVVDIKKI